MLEEGEELPESDEEKEESKDEEERIEQEVERAVIKGESVREWHIRIAHPSKNKLIEANKKYRLRLDPKEIDKFYEKVCEVCVRANMKRRAIHHRGGQHPLMVTIDTGVILYVDMFGPSTVLGEKSNGKMGMIPCPSIYGENYGLVAVEGFSRHVRYCSITNKSEATKKIIEWIEEIERETGRTIVILHTDNAGDFCNIELEEYLKKKGIQIRNPTAYHPEHNGVVERMIGKLKSIMRSVLVASGAPIELWNKAVEWSVLMHNSLPMKVINYETPFGKYNNYRFDVGNKVRVWGCNAFVLKTKRTKSKYQPYSWGGFLVGWKPRWLAYEIMNQKGRIQISRDVIFNEFSFSAITEFRRKIDNREIKLKKLKRIPEETEINFEVVESEEADQEEEKDDNEQIEMEIEDTEVNRPTRKEMISEKVKDIIEELNEKMAERDKRRGYSTMNAIMAVVTGISDKKDLDRIIFSHPSPWFKPAPKSYNEAKTYEDWLEWEGAIKDEYNSLMKNNTWILVDKQPWMKPLGCKWVLDYKLGEFNELLRRKARLVIKGYAQHYGVDYFETHSPVVKAKSIRIMLIITAVFDLELKHIDFDTAFLNGFLLEEVYMIQPEGFEIGNPLRRVCKLIKSIYGLKQAARVWYQSINELLNKLGWKATQVDPCFYTKVTKTGNKMFMSLYVDDSGIAYKKCDEAEWIADKTAISEVYKIKDIGDMHWILNMKVTRDREKRTITLSQEAYINGMLEKFKLKHAESVDNPELVKSLNIESEMLNEEDHAIYRSLVGGLLYAAITTRMDIAHSVGQLSRYLARPTLQHLLAARHTLKYLKGTSKLGLKLGTHQDLKDVENKKSIASIENEWLNLMVPDSRTMDLGHESQENRMNSDLINHELSVPMREVCRTPKHENGNYNPFHGQKNGNKRTFDGKSKIAIVNGKFDGLDVKMFASTDDRQGKHSRANAKDKLIAWSDANWGSDEVDRRSVTGYILKLFGSPVSWVSKRQATVALSTTEAEYMAVSSTVQEALWFRMWIREVLNKDVQVPVNCDNQASIRLTHAESDSQRTKHIDIRHHFIRDHVTKGDIKMDWIETEKQEADLLTKRLPTHRFNYLRDLLLVECD